MVIYDATSNSSFAYESSPKTQLNLHSINRKHPQIPAKRMELASLIPTSKFSIGNLRTQTRTQIITSLAIPRSQHSRLYSLPNSDSIEARTPSMSEILETSRAQKLDLELQTLGPFFRITAKSLETKNEIGRAEGIIRVWLGGTILHLDSIRLQREALGMEKSIFGIGLFIGGVAVRYGYDCGCRTAELMAINDSDLYHQKVLLLLFFFF